MKPTLILALLISWSTPGFAQEALTLDQAIEKVKSYSQELKSVIAERKTNKLSRREALGRALPQISANVGHSDYFKIPSFGGFQLQGNYELEYGVTVSQALYTFGAVGAALKAAKVGLEKSDLDVLVSELNAEYVAKAAYYNILLAQRNVEINEGLLKYAQDNLNILNRSFSGGRPPQGDAIQIQADIENKKPMVENALADLKIAKANLNILMGEAPTKPLKVVGELNSRFPNLNYDILERQIDANSPSLKAQEKFVEFQSSYADVMWAETMPKLGAFYRFNTIQQSLGEGRFDNDRQLDTSVWGLSITWNIWDGGITHTNYQKAKVQVSQAEIQLQASKDQLNQQVVATMEKLNGYKNNVESYRKAVDLARRSFQLSQNRFRSGKTSITELNQTQSLLLQSEMQQAQNLFQMNMSFAQIENLIGSELQK